MTLRSSLLALALLVGATSFADAQAPLLKDSVVIRNNTSITITYQVRFNGDAWTSHTLLPGDKTAHFTTKPLALAPRVEVRFNDLYPYPDVIHQDVLTSFVANPFSATAYNFRVIGGRLFLMR